MAFISVFDVLGPNMIGPSSSHTAGAEIIAFLAQKMIAPPLKRVDFTLYGSFAKTYHGHGTDRALLGGVMGFSADDTRIRESFAIATERGLAYSFTPNEAETDIYPNTVDIRMHLCACSAWKKVIPPTPSWSRMNACPRAWINCCWKTRTSVM